MPACPNNCHLWARLFNPKEPATLHHPRCEHVDDSLIDVWKVSDGSSSYFTTNERDGQLEAENADGVTITKQRMHREVFAALPEFDGF